MLGVRSGKKKGSVKIDNLRPTQEFNEVTALLVDSYIAVLKQYNRNAPDATDDETKALIEILDVLLKHSGFKVEQVLNKEVSVEIEQCLGEFSEQLSQRGGEENSIELDDSIELDADDERSEQSLSQFSEQSEGGDVKADNSINSARYYDSLGRSYLTAYDADEIVFLPLPYFPRIFLDGPDQELETEYTNCFSARDSLAIYKFVNSVADLDDLPSANVADVRERGCYNEALFCLYHKLEKDCSVTGYMAFLEDLPISDCLSTGEKNGFQYDCKYVASNHRELADLLKISGEEQEFTRQEFTQVENFEQKYIDALPKLIREEFAEYISVDEDSVELLSKDFEPSGEVTTDVSTLSFPSTCNIEDILGSMQEQLYAVSTSNKEMKDQLTVVSTSHEKTIEQLKQEMRDRVREEENAKISAERRDIRRQRIWDIGDAGGYSSEEDNIDSNNVKTHPRKEAKKIKDGQSFEPKLVKKKAEQVGGDKNAADDDVISVGSESDMEGNEFGIGDTVPLSNSKNSSFSSKDEPSDSNLHIDEQKNIVEGQKDIWRQGSFSSCATGDLDLTYYINSHDEDADFAVAGLKQEMLRLKDVVSSVGNKAGDIKDAIDQMQKELGERFAKSDALRKENHAKNVEKIRSRFKEFREKVLSQLKPHGEDHRSNLLQEFSKNPSSDKVEALTNSEIDVDRVEEKSVIEEGGRLEASNQDATLDQPSGLCMNNGDHEVDPKVLQRGKSIHKSKTPPRKNSTKLEVTDADKKALDYGEDLIVEHQAAQPGSGGNLGANQGDGKVGGSRKFISLIVESPDRKQKERKDVLGQSREDLVGQKSNFRTGSAKTGTQPGPRGQKNVSGAGATKLQEQSAYNSHNVNESHVGSLGIEKRKNAKGGNGGKDEKKRFNLY